MSSDRYLEPTPAEYARSHGLSIDHIREPLPLSDVVVLRNGISESLTSDSHLKTIENPIYIDQHEHISGDHDADLLILAANGNLDSGNVEHTIESLLDVRRVRKIRLEAPLLSSDAETGLSSFGKWKEPHPKDGELPMEPLDESLNEGMAWPSEVQALPTIVMESLESEKIAVTKDILLFLQSQIKDDWSDEDKSQFWKAITTYKMGVIPEPVTPPLPEMSPILTPYIPSSPVCHLPLLSDPFSLLSDDLRAIEEAIFDKDDLAFPITCSSIESQKDFVADPYDTTDNLECDPDLGRIKAEDRKVEVPLTPLKTNFAEAVSPNERTCIEELLIDQVTGEEDLELFSEAFRDAAASANRKLEQEHLHEADSKNRVKIPVMDFNLPIPPWKLTQTHEAIELRVHQRLIITNVLETYGQIYSWPGTKKLDSTLPWTAFSFKLALVSFDEEFWDEGKLNAILGSSMENKIIESSSLTWKRPGFKILENDEDDEINDFSFDRMQIEDVPALAKKRKMKFNEQRGQSTDDIRTEKATAVTNGRQEGEHYLQNGEHENTANLMNINAPVSAKNMEVESNNPTSLLLGASFSASKAVDNFLELTASKRQKPIGNTYIPMARSSSKDLRYVHERHVVDASETKNQTLPHPSINLPSTQIRFIASTILFKRHSLIRALRNLIPGAEIIERDFTTHNVIKWLPNSVSRSPILSPLASESDIIISPSTGVVLTNIRKISQQPLPGQKAKVEIRDRIERVCLRYERLLVLVSEGNEEEIAIAPSKTDYLAMAEFLGFCSSLETTIIVHFVAGGEGTLAKWLLAMMIRYGTQDTSIRLLQEETLWELFLRRAGMNAFAAQAVLSALKAPEDVDRDVARSGMFGLARFVEMGAEERNRMFESPLGGRRVLELVGKCIDAKWI